MLHKANQYLDIDSDYVIENDLKGNTNQLTLEDVISLERMQS
jgi:hypothetical protein